MNHFWLRTNSLPGAARPTETCSGTRKSSSSAARHKRLLNPAASKVASMAAAMRKSRLLPVSIAADATTSSASVNAAPVRVIL